MANETGVGDHRGPNPIWAEMARLADLGFRVVVSSVLGMAGGLWLDRKLGLIERFPLLTLVGTLLGLAAGMMAVVRAVSQATTGRSRRTTMSNFGTLVRFAALSVGASALAGGLVGGSPAIDAAAGSLGASALQVTAAWILLRAHGAANDRFSDRVRTCRRVAGFR